MLTVSTKGVPIAGEKAVLSFGEHAPVKAHHCTVLIIRRGWCRCCMELYEVLGSHMCAPSTLTDRAPSFGDALATAGIVTDVHYADAPAEGTRVYRDSPMKVKDAVATFNKTGVDFVVSLGDFKVDILLSCGLWLCMHSYVVMYSQT